MESEMARGVFTSAKESERYTLSECLDRYAEEYLPRHKDPRREVSRIKRLQKYPLVKKIMATIRSKDIADFRRTRENEGAAPDTIRLDFALLSRLFNFARSNWGMENLGNPVQLTTKPKLPKGRERRLEEGEEARLLAACDPDFAPIVRFALATAMRRGEIVSLRWEDVNLKASKARLVDTKNGESRTVPLSMAAKDVLKELPRHISGRVFPYHPDHLSARMAKACQAAGLENLRFHDLRHEATSRFFEETDLDVMEVKAITGHKTLQMLARYTHLRTHHLAARLDGAKRGS